MTLILSRRAAARVLTTAVAVVGGTLALPAAPATAATPQVTVTTTATNPTTGLTLRVEGTGFTAVTNAGDAGVYVGLAPRGGLPDVSSSSQMDSFAAAAWVNPAQMPGGSFTTSLTAAPEKLDPAKSYSVYTWQAHTHSNNSQDTETPVTIDWAALVAPSSVTATFAKKPKPGKKGKLSVAVSGAGSTPTGSVTVELARKGTAKTKQVTGTLVNGAVTLTLPKLKTGKWTLTTTYAGDRRHGGSVTTTKVKVKAPQ